MSNSAVSLIFVYLSSRLFFYEINSIIAQKKITWGRICSRLAYGFTLFFLVNDFSFIPLYVAYAILVFIDSKTQFRNASAGYIYFFHMLLNLIFIPWLVVAALYNFEFISNPFSISLLFDPVIFIKTLIISSGFFFTINEGTIVIRLVLNRIKAVPHKDEALQHKDEQEYERGKLIGILERTFFYFLILLNQIGAIAVIIALKSLARFKELDKKNFAEYFLIGSLLSLLTASVPAIIVIYLLNF